MTPATSLLRRLRDVPEFELATGEPDPRGWTVRGGDGQPFGTVHELLVDPATLRVVYLDVVLDPKLGNPPAETHIVLPIGPVNFDPEASNVFITSLRRQTIKSYPPFVELQVSPALEAAMQRALAGWE